MRRSTPATPSPSPNGGSDRFASVVGYARQPPGGLCMRALRWGFVLVALVCGLSNAASAEDKFPNRPIKFVVGFLAGGPTDTIARLMCDYLAAHIGQPCVVENKTGQGGMLAAQAVVNSPADGYTLLFVAPNNFIGNSLYKNLSFVHVRDTAPIAGIMKVTNIMVVP